MIIHRHEDGTEGYLYANGDLAVITAENQRNVGKIGRVWLNDSEDRKNGHGTVISFVSLYHPDNKQCIASNIPVWDIAPAVSTYRNCGHVVNCIQGEPIDEFFLNKL